MTSEERAKADGQCPYEPGTDDSWVWVNGWMTGRDSLRAELENERERVLKLFKFTRHNKNCAGIQGVNEDYGVPCTCGLSDLVNDYEASCDE